MLVYVPAGRTEADDALGFYTGSQRCPLDTASVIKIK